MLAARDVVSDVPRFISLDKNTHRNAPAEPERSMDDALEPNTPMALLLSIPEHAHDDTIERECSRFDDTIKLALREGTHIVGCSVVVDSDTFELQNMRRPPFMAAPRPRPTPLARARTTANTSSHQKAFLLPSAHPLAANINLTNHTCGQARSYWLFLVAGVSNSRQRMRMRRSSFSAACRLELFISGDGLRTLGFQRTTYKGNI